jgi:hypothetical protein
MLNLDVVGMEKMWLRRLAVDDTKLSASGSSLSKVNTSPWGSFFHRFERRSRL